MAIQHQHRFLYYWIVVCVLLAYVIWTAPLQSLDAQQPILTPILTKATATPTESPTPTATPNSEIIIIDYYTVPGQVRVREPFELHLELRNIGTLPAGDVSLENTQCHTPGDVIISEGPCLIDLSTIDIDQSVHVKLKLRAFQSSTIAKTLPVNLQLKFKTAFASSMIKQFSVGIYFLPELPITEPSPELERQFPKPNLIVNKTWTAKAHATVGELLTVVPLVINSEPIADAGGPEFELVVELQNQGDAEATNIFIDFCDTNQKFNPVGSTCRKYVPTNLPRGANAVASQTLAYKASVYNTPPPPPPVGEQVILTITYDFWYADQWVKESVRQTVYLYPQAFPALTPTPTNLPAGAFLRVNTEWLNIRQGPSTDYPIIAVVRKGDQFRLIGRNSDSTWWQIDFNGSPAWVSAELVIPTGTEAVPVILNIPPPPPRSFSELLLPEPTSSLLASSDIMTSEAESLPAQAEADPFLGGETLLVQSDHQTDQGNLISVNQQPFPEQSRLSNLDSSNQVPLVVVESYHTLPAQPLGDRPFQIEFVLRNVGGVTAQQLMLGWNGERIVPIGTGPMWWLDPLSPGERTTVAGQFAFVTQMSESVVQLPIQILYVDENGQMAQHTEQITLLRQVSDQSGLPVIQPMSPSPKPLWLRILFGLAGLGAESP